MPNACLYIVLIGRQNRAPSVFVGYVVSKTGIRKANKRTPKMVTPPERKTWSWLDRTELGKLEERGIELERVGYFSRVEFSPHSQRTNLALQGQ
jgi:hypothetical protein